MANESGGNYCFTWKIENFSMCPQATGECLKSPQFTPTDINKVNYNLTLFPNGVNEKYKNFLSLYINRTSKNFVLEDINEIDLKFEGIRANGDIIRSFEKQNLLLKPNETWGVEQFLPRRIINGENDAIYYTDITKDWEKDILTICCTVYDRKLEVCKALTKVDVDHCFLKRKIASPRNLLLKSDEEFTIFGNIKIKISLMLLFEYCNYVIPVDFFINGEFSGSLRLSCKVSLLDTDDTEIISKKDTRLIKAKDSWSFPKFIFYSEKFGEGFKYDQSYIFLFDFTIANGNYSNELISPTYERLPKINNVSKLEDDLQDLYNNKLHHDIELCVDEKLFTAHKSILAARSPVFLAMLDQNMLETQTGIVNIPDVEAEVFQYFLKYMYTAKICEINYDIASRLFIVADKYQVLTLKSSCAGVLMSALSEENVCEVLALADKVNDLDLKMFAHDYVAQHAKDILSSSDWMQWCEMNIKLASEVISNIATNFELLPKKGEINPCKQ